jgi:DNA sulfur modification protein DndD
MAEHLQNFARLNLKNKTRGYLFSLGIIYRHRLETGRLSEKIKDKIAEKGLELLKVNVERHALRYAKFISAQTVDVVIDPIEALSLKAMRVKDFRGFGSLGNDDHGSHIEFNSGKNIFFAPNGGGKTSLCEALEFVLTGSIKEADRRRTKMAEYIRRGDGKPKVAVKANDNSLFKGSRTLSSCFIDRNRLQEFSLLGSKDTNADQKDVLAALFGLEEIENIISRFVQPKSFGLSNLKKNDVRSQQQVNKIKLLSSVEIKSSNLEKIDRSRKEICEALEIDKYDGYLIFVKLQRLKRLLKFKEVKLIKEEMTLMPTYSSFRFFSLFVVKAKRIIARYRDTQFEISEKLSEAAFEDLFIALVTLSDMGESADYCPACLTPIEDVKRNPYRRAKRELEELSQLGDVRKLLIIRKQHIRKIVEDCYIFFSTVASNEKFGINFEEYLTRKVVAEHPIDKWKDLDIQEMISLLEGLIDWFGNQSSGVNAYLSACQAFSEKRQDGSDARQARQKLIDHIRLIIDKVGYSVKKIKETRAEIRTAIPELLSLKDRLRQSDKNLAKEMAFNTLLEEIESEYSNLYQDLLSYKISAESSQIAGIEQKSTQYYQSINLHDDDSDKVTAIIFDRLTSGYRIKILDKYGNSQDAFSCLSEGHLRSLGLSLLLAVANKYQYPFVIFDDVVNAIDAEHRANIVHLLFNDEYLSKVQQVITTHDRLFWERYCNSGRSKFGKENFLGRVLNCTNRGIVIIDYDAGFKSKILRALELYDVRQALIYCRIWLESMIARYCTDKQLTISASFSSRQLRPSNFLEITLESTYLHVENAVRWDMDNINIVKKDLINWRGQNQEHHAFDEKSFNFVHAKTSGEVKVIFESVERLEYQLFPADFLQALSTEKLALENKVTRVNVQLENSDFVAKAPKEKVKEYSVRRDELLNMLTKLDADLKYVELSMSKAA